jgi:hypothetical protein
MVETLYFADASSIQRFSHGRFLACPGRGGTPIEISARTVDILTNCRGAQPLGEHASVAWRLGLAPTLDALTMELDALIATGLLRKLPRQRTTSPGATTSAARRSLNTVVIVTANRPAALRRCLDRLASTFQQYGRQPRVLVIDGSRDESATAAAIADVRRSMAIEYVDRSAAAELRRMLVARGVPAPVAALSTSLGSAGENRNVALLLTAGDDVLMIDDDIVPDLWSHPDRRGGMIVGGHQDMREWSFFASRREATAGLHYVDVDLLRAHEELLGKPLSMLLEANDAVDFEHTCSHTLSALSESKALRVRCTFAGLAGDSARYCAHRLLFASGSTHRRLITDHSAIGHALTSREIRHIATDTFITHEPVGFASYCMGLSNTPWSPPFPRMSLGEDTVFASTLAFIDPEALFAHLPIGVVHDSARPSALADPMPSAHQTTMWEHMLYVLKQVSRPAFDGDVARRLEAYGATLTAFAGMPDRELSSALREASMAARCQPLAMLDAALANHPYPESWRTAFENYRRVFLEAAAGEAFHIPVDCASDGTVDAGLRETRRFMNSAGELMQAWPDVCRAAALAAYRTSNA